VFTTHLLTFYYLSLFRPGVEFVTGPGLLDATRLRLRKRELIEAGEKRLEAGPVGNRLDSPFPFGSNCRAPGIRRASREAVARRIAEPWRTCRLACSPRGGSGLTGPA
jgi:hypothetical protein